jgi:hypothetical protein
MIEVCYPYHPLHGQTAVVLRKEQCHGDCHLRVITEGGEERLVPQWMFEPHAFDPSPVALPLIGLDALRDLLRIVFSSGLRLSERDQAERDREGRFHDPIASVSTASGSRQAAPRRGAKASK